MRVGVIGMGVMGENHLRVYKKLGVEVVGICDIKYDEEKGIENKYCFNDYKKLIKLKPDIISITVPTKLHRKIVISCINAGINVLIEKPMASTVKDCDRIIKFAKKKNVKVMVGHIERFNPAVIELKKHLSDVGEIYKISAKRVGPFHPRIRDVGVTMDLGVHDIDIMFWLMGERVQWCAVTKSVITNRDDIFYLNVEFKNGAIGMIETDWVSPKKVRRLEIIGERGLFQLDYLNKTLSLLCNNGNAYDYDISRIEPLELELTSFIKSVEADMEPEISGEDGRKAVYYAEKFING